VQLKFLY